MGRGPGGVSAFQKLLSVVSIRREEEYSLQLSDIPRKISTVGTASTKAQEMRPIGLDQASKVVLKGKSQQDGSVGKPLDMITDP